jgi:photosystem II stability/assembly factor-like uncharacterized protein
MKTEAMLNDKIGLSIKSTSWTQITPPHSGSISSLVAIENTIYAATTGGIYRSTDQGANWTPINDGLNSKEISALTADGKTLYAAAWNGGVYCLTDNGANWTQVNMSEENSHLQILTLVINQKRLYSGAANGGIFCSTDNGISWTVFGLQDFLVWGLAVKNSEIFAVAFWAGIHPSIYHSIDDGLSWTEIKIKDCLEPSVKGLSVNGAALFVMANGVEGVNSVYRSDDNGVNWTKVTEAPEGQDIDTLAVSGSHIFAGTKSSIFVQQLN